MAPAHKLTYFDLRALGEPIRYLFAYGGLEFEDNRVSASDGANWMKLKETTPFGQLPLLEHNGKVVNQSLAIQRYVAKQVGLAGKDDWENLEIDAIVDTINDFRLKLTMVILPYEQDPEKKKAIIDSFVKETTPYYLSRIEAQVKENNGFLALGRLTWADLYFASVIAYPSYRAGVDLISNYPALVALVKKVESQPGIKEWIEIRPQTEF